MRAYILTIGCILALGCADTEQAALPVDMGGSDLAFSDALSPDTTTLDQGVIDVAVPDVREPDAARSEDQGATDGSLPEPMMPDQFVLPDMEVDAGLVPRAGFTVEQIRQIISLSDPPPPPPNPTNRFADDPDVALLGQAFFFTDELGPSFVNCVTCHDPRSQFTRMLSYDGLGGLNFRSVPSLVGIASLPWFFWDGRADSLWAQARTPLEHNSEMASDRVYIAHAIYNNPVFKRHYEASFGPLPPMDDAERFPPRGRPGAEYDVELNAPWFAMSEDDRIAVNQVLANVGKAFEAFFRRLRHQETVFDRFARALVSGEQLHLDFMPDRAKEGLALFIGPAGCTNCHYGPLLTDGQFHNLGAGAYEMDERSAGRILGIEEVLGDEFNAAGAYSDDPDGPRGQRIANLMVTPTDEGAFRTPSLRNVTRTGPFGHDGRFRTLDEMLAYKNRPTSEPPGARDPLLEVIELTEYEVGSLRAFLETLLAPPVPLELRTAPQLE